MRNNIPSFSWKLLTFTLLAITLISLSFVFNQNFQICLGSQCKQINVNTNPSGKPLAKNQGIQNPLVFSASPTKSIRLQNHYHGTANNEDGRSDWMDIQFYSSTSGSATFGPEYNSDGHFSNFTINDQGNLDFEVIGNDDLIFKGTLNKDGSMNGSYYFNGGSGTWIVYPK